MASSAPTPVAEAGEGLGVSPEDPPSSVADADALIVDLNLQVADVDPPLAGWLDTQLARLARLAGATGELAVTVVDDATMADLHERYKNVPGTTDVLTFDLRDEPDTPDAPDESDPAAGAVPRVEGDVVVCLDEAARQSAARGHPVRVELLLYAVHGLLHLLGEDDQTPEQADRMHRREDALLEAAGFGAVFDTGHR
jgi:probable rRNA maturation factor